MLHHFYHVSRHATRADIVLGIASSSGALSLRLFLLLSLIALLQLVQDKAVGGVELDHRLMRAAHVVGAPLRSSAAIVGAAIVRITTN